MKRNQGMHHCHEGLYEKEKLEKPRHAWAHQGWRGILDCLQCSHCHCTLFSLKKRCTTTEMEADVWTTVRSECYHEESLLPLLARPKALSSAGGSSGDPRLLLVFLLFLNQCYDNTLHQWESTLYFHKAKKIGLEFQEFIFSKTKKKRITCPINYTLCLVEHSPGR